MVKLERLFEVEGIRIFFEGDPTDGEVAALRFLLDWMETTRLIYHLTSIWVGKEEISLYFLNAVEMSFEYDRQTGEVGELTEISGV